jgi:hypothetical protein
VLGHALHVKSGGLVKKLALALATLVLALSASAPVSSAAPIAQSGVVASAYDGDTLTLTDGRRVGCCATSIAGH